MSPHDVEAFFFLFWNVNRSLMKLQLRNFSYYLLFWMGIVCFFHFSAEWREEKMIFQSSHSRMRWVHFVNGNETHTFDIWPFHLTEANKNVVALVVAVGVSALMWSTIRIQIHAIIQIPSIGYMFRETWNVIISANVNREYSIKTSDVLISAVRTGESGVVGCSKLKK